MATLNNNHGNSIGLTTSATPPNFKCPENNGFFGDPKQCDKYYECQDNVPEEKLCPDGLLFEIKNPNHERCDLPFNVDCGERTELRKSLLGMSHLRKNKTNKFPCCHRTRRLHGPVSPEERLLLPRGPASL